MRISVNSAVRDLVLRFLAWDSVSDECLTAQTLLGHMLGTGPVYFLWKRIRNCIQILHSVHKATNHLYERFVYAMVREEAAKVIR
jgi:hypothetical protein